MEKQKEKQKTKHPGFGLRLTIAIIFALFTIGMAIGIYFSGDLRHSNSFIEWYSFASYSRHETIYKDEPFDFTTDTQYESWSSFELIYDYYDEDIREVLVIVDYSFADKSRYNVYYYFVSDNIKAKTATFKSEDGETITFSYENFDYYQTFVECKGWIHGSEPIIALGVIITITVLLFLGAIVGRKRKWGNVIHIVIGAILFALAIVTFISIAIPFDDSANIFGAFIYSIFIIIPALFPFIGGIKGIKHLRKNKEKAAQPATAQTASQNTAENFATVQEASQNEAENVLLKTLADYPVDYENKPTVSQMLDLENTENIVLTSETGDKYEFRQLYVTVYQDNLYFLAETVGLSKEDGGGAFVFSINYNEDTVTIVEDDNICEAIWNEYNNKLNAQFEQQNIKRSDFALDLYDVSVDEKDWKEFKKTASQEDLAVIAIGAKYRIVKNRIKNIIYALGIILSIPLLFVTEGWSLIAYPIFSFLATKSIRYKDTFDQSYRKLSKDYKAFVDKFYNSSVGLKILDALVSIGIFWITIPYQALLIGISMVAPNFVIAKNGVLIPIPNGYDIGNLGVISDYYSSFNFIDEATENTKSSSKTATTNDTPSPTDEYYKQDEYSYVDSHGYTQTVYTDHGGKDAYDAGGHYVGKISGKGDDKKIVKADKDSDEEE